jgi:hypothetical protein
MPMIRVVGGELRQRSAKVSHPPPTSTCDDLNQSQCDTASHVFLSGFEMALDALLSIVYRVANQQAVKPLKSRRRVPK